MDNSWWYGASGTSSRHGNVNSYAFSNDLMSMQLDGAYGGPEGNDTDSDESLQKVEFGLSVNIGDMGKVALAHTDDKYSKMAPHLIETATDGTYDYFDTSTWETKSNSIAAEISVSDLTVYVGTQTEKKTNTTGAQPNDWTAPVALFSDGTVTPQQFAGPHYQGEKPEGWQSTNAAQNGSALANAEQKTTECD